MGRYYSGDITGKFWPAVQESTDASFFGGEMTEPKYIHYYFGQEDLPRIEKGVKTCLSKLGKNKEKLDQFFAKNNGYNEESLIQAGFRKDKAWTLLAWYARHELGEKILKRVQDHGSCSFEAEV